MNKLLVGRYELIEKIGEGGMAVVYKSMDRFLNRYVAIKILRPEFTKDQQFVDSFRKESQAAAGLQHPNIISVYDVGREGNIHFIVMELVDGKPLSDIIKERAPMDYREAIKFTKQVASALSLAHRHNIIHRDIKPHNIMVTRDGVAKLGDFGIAKAVSDSTLTETSTIMGSVHYFSPEQARGAYVDERSDIYSLGIVLYEMLTGDVPFDGDNPVQVALMHINDEIKSPTHLVPGIPPSLEKLVMKATDKFQSNRYRNADEMLEDLKNIEFVTNMVGDSIYAAGDIQQFRERENARRQQESYARDEKKDDKNSKEKPKKKGKKIIFAVIAIVVLAGIMGALYATGLINGKVTVPDVTNLSYEDAKEKIESAGLVIKRGDKINSDEIEKGKIAKQDPEGFQKVKKGTVVTVNISAGVATQSVPNLIGKYYDEEDTEAVVKQAGFELGDVNYAKSDEYEKGQIIKQDPQSSAVVEEGTPINITVCSGKKTEKVSVPSLTGLSLTEAKAKLKSYDLQVGKILYEESTTYSKGTVMWQQYDSGTLVEKNASVSIKVSKGAPSTDEPDDTDDMEED